MKKLISTTGREDIDLTLISAEIIGIRPANEIVLKWDFSGLNFNPELLLVVDLFVPGTTENRRLEIGVLQNPLGVKKVDISTMINPLEVKVRFKVIDRSGTFPRIHASVDKVSPKLPDEDNSRSLLPIVRKEDLGVPWMLVFDLGVPKLYITEKGGLYKLLRDRTKASWFYPVIMHEVFKCIFEWLAMSDNFENEEKAAKWKNLFIEKYSCPKDFFDNLSGKDFEERREDVTNQSRFISESVAALNSDIEKLSQYFTLDEEEN